MVRQGHAGGGAAAGRAGIALALARGARRANGALAVLAWAMCAFAGTTSSPASAADRSASPNDASAAPANYRDKNFDYFVAGDPRKPRAAHTHFGLALMGGGGRIDAAYSFIAQHAGRGHIVILRAVSDDSFDPDDGDYGVSFTTRWGPVVSAETIVFHNRDASFDPRVAAILRAADGVFLAGGDQGNYIRYWKGTPVQDALNAHVRANRPIGGSSAGLAILGRYSYTALDGGSLESKIALGDPYNSGVTLESDFLHVRRLENVITDTHFSTRCRLGRLIVFVARIAKDQPGTRVFGLGIDEQTAMLVGEDGVGRVASGSAGSAWLVVAEHPARILTIGQPMTIDGVRITRVDRAGTIDLNVPSVRNAAAATVDAIVKGLPTRVSVASSIMMRSAVPPDES